MTASDKMSKARLIDAAIRHKYPTLLSILQPEKILTSMYEKEIICSSDKERIKETGATKGGKAMAEQVLTHVLRQNGLPLLDFMDILKKKQPVAYKHIKETIQDTKDGKLDLQYIIRSGPKECVVHDTEIVKYFCKDCATLLCQECQETHDNDHDIETIEHALLRIVPEVERQALCLGDGISNYEQAVRDMEVRIKETKTYYENCRNDVDAAAEEKIEKIRVAQEKLKVELKQQQNKNIDELKNLTKDLRRKYNKRERLLKEVKTALEQPKDAHLLDHLAGSEHDLCSKLDEEVHTIDTIFTNITLPKLLHKNIWKEECLLGKLVFNMMSLFWMTGSVVTFPTSKRVHCDGFTEVLSTKFKKISDIKLPGFCFRLSIINDKLWVPLWDKNKIKVLNTEDSTTEETLTIPSPRSLDMSHTGDIMVACREAGLYRVNPGEEPVKVADGNFSDVSVCGESVYAWECLKKQVVEFQKENNSEWKWAWAVDASCVANSSNVDTLLVKQPSEPEGSLQFYICCYQDNTVYHISVTGQLIKQYRNEGASKSDHHFLCGIDKDDQLLLADLNQKAYRLLDAYTGKTENLMSAEHNVYDVTLDGPSRLWMLQKRQGKTSIISKYED